MLRLARPVDDATHDRDAHRLDTRVPQPPLGHSLTDVTLDVLGHVLEECRRGPSATGTRGDLRRKAAKPERLQDLLRDRNFFGAVTVRARRQRNANRVT